jgi:hypothetical protein
MAADKAEALRGGLVLAALYRMGRVFQVRQRLADRLRGG